MRASLAVIGFALGMAAWWKTGDDRWLGGALLLGIASTALLAWAAMG